MEPVVGQYTALSNRVDNLRTRHRKLHQEPVASDKFEVLQKQLRQDISQMVGQLSVLADGEHRFQVLLDQSQSLLVALDRMAPGTTTRTRSKPPSRSNTGTTTGPTSTTTRTQKVSKNKKTSQQGAKSKPVSDPPNGKGREAPNSNAKTPPRVSPKPTETFLVTEELLELSLALTPDPLTVVGIDKATGKKIVRLVDMGLLLRDRRVEVEADQERKVQVSGRCLEGSFRADVGERIRKWRTSNQHQVSEMFGSRLDSTQYVATCVAVHRRHRCCGE